MTTGLLRTAAVGLAAAGLGALASGGTPAHAEELTVYTAIEADDLAKYAERFNKDHPDIDIQWVRDSTGIITAKLLAEKDNPQADAVWGLAATSLMLLKNEGMLERPMPRQGWSGSIRVSSTAPIHPRGPEWTPGRR